MRAYLLRVVSGELACVFDFGVVLVEIRARSERRTRSRWVYNAIAKSAGDCVDCMKSNSKQQPVSKKEKENPGEGGKGGMKSH